MGKSTSQTEKRSSWQRRPFLLIVVVLLVVWWLWGASARANLEPQRSFTDRIFRTVTFQPIDSPLLSTEVAVNSFMSAHAGDFVGQPGAAGAIGNKGERGDKGDSATTPSIGNTRPTLSFDSSNLGLTILGGNTVDLSVLATDKIDDADSSPLNEIQSATVGGGLFLGADSSVGLIRTCSSNQVLKWDGSAWACSVSTAGGAIALDDLTDVTIASPVSGSTLKYNGSEWVVGNDTDTTYSAAGGLSLVGTTFSLDSSLGVFKTIDTSLGTDPIADSLTDALSLLSGDGVNVTGSSAADSVTFSANLVSDGGLMFAGGALTLLNTCSNTQFLAWNSGGSSWTCTSPTGQANLFSTIGGDSGSAIADTSSDTLTIAGGNGINTVAADSPDSVTLDVDLAAGGGLAFASGALRLSACSDGQILKVSGSSWACAADNSTPTGSYRQHLAGADNITIGSSMTPLLTNGSGTALNLPITINSGSEVSYFSTIEISSSLATGPVTFVVIRDDNNDNDCQTGGGDGTQVGALTTTLISSVAQSFTTTISFADTSPGTTAPRYQLCASTTIATGTTTASDRSLKLEEVNY